MLLPTCQFTETLPYFMIHHLRCLLSRIYLHCADEDSVTSLSDNSFVRSNWYLETRRHGKLSYCIVNSIVNSFLLQTRCSNTLLKHIAQHTRHGRLLDVCNKRGAQENLPNLSGTGTLSTSVGAWHRPHRCEESKHHGSSIEGKINLATVLEQQIR